MPEGLLRVSTFSYGILLPSLSINLCGNTGEYQECYKLPSPQNAVAPKKLWSKNLSILIVDNCNYTHTTVTEYTSVHSIHLASFPGSSPAFLQYVKKAGEESGNETVYTYKYSFDELILKIWNNSWLYWNAWRHDKENEDAGQEYQCTQYTANACSQS